METEIDQGGRAFAAGSTNYWQGGMTTRTWLAGQALKGLLSNPQFEPNEKGASIPLSARYAMQSCLLADALIAELKKGPKC